MKFLDVVFGVWVLGVICYFCAEELLWRLRKKWVELIWLDSATQNRLNDLEVRFQNLEKAVIGHFAVSVPDLKKEEQKPTDEKPADENKEGENSPSN